jgi:ribosomal protein L16 Arg81 hydroxylase/Flp pilus assembly protein TadD
VPTNEEIALAVAHHRAGRERQALAIAGRDEIENALGTERAQERDLAGAAQHYRAALALTPDFFKAHNNLGNVLRDQGDLDGAVAHYRQAIRAQPNAMRVHTNLGNTLRDLGLWLEARDAYRRALELGASAVVALRLAEIYEELGDPQRAFAAYDRATAMGEPAAAARRELLAAAVQRFGPFGRPPRDPTASAAPATTKGRAVRRRLVDAVGGGELAALLAPVTPETFVREYWGKRPLFVKGFADKYKGFFDGDGFIKATANPGSAPADALRASFDKRVPIVMPPPGAPPEIPSMSIVITPKQAGVLFEAGATLCMSEVQTRVPELAAFCAAIKEQLGYVGKVAFNGYMSPAGAGFNWHFDARMVTKLQLEGTKRWRFSRRPAVDWPKANGVRMTDGSGRYGDAEARRLDWERIEPLDEREVTTVLLEPGDLLILPAGVWHDAEGGSTGSLALNMSILPISYTKIVDELLDGTLSREASWRAAAPLLPASSRAEREVDPEGIEAIRDELKKASATLAEIADDPAALATLWASMVKTLRPPIAGKPGDDKEH